MNIFLDTTQNLFVACLFGEKYQIIFKTIKDTKYKVEEITNFFNYLLINHKININDIKNFYINIGPGSFTGSRIALVYVRTIAQITHAKIWVTNSFKLLISSEKILTIKANKNHSYQINWDDIDNLLKTNLVFKSTLEQEIDYPNLLSHFIQYIDLFSCPDPLSIKPEYGSLPQIGSRE